MEGLLIAEQLRLLADQLPAERLPWRFPDDRTCVLPLLGELTLHIASRPPNPFIRVGSGAPEAARPRTPFQEQLRARAAGRLLSAVQPQLDRVVRLEFAGEEGFVPTPPVELVVELTGRNANLILLDERGYIIGVERQVLAERNRYRELKVGLKYVPPPPYSKLDPRTANDAELAGALEGKPLSKVSSVVDGVGPQLSAALAAALATGAESPANHTAGAALSGDALRRTVELLKELAAAPAAFLALYGAISTPGALQRQERREQRLKSVTAALEKQLQLARRRLADAERALQGADEAGRLRAEGDLLLAYARQVPPAATSVELTSFDGEAVLLSLDPKLDAAANARARYDQARRREARAERAGTQMAELRSAVTALEHRLQGLTDLPEAALAQLVEQMGEERRAAQRAPDRPGTWFRGPHGFEVVVGRNARDNDKVTFGVGRSRDVWLHAQGYRGSHVIIRSGGKEVPFETVLFAARLAAGYSEAFRSDNVPVDYTARKNVWKVKGGAPGAVNFTQHRTVYVTPARDDAGALAEDSDQP